MKIFYGVQGTGNGHITRSRVMAKALYAAGIEVTFQFSGRAAEKYFDMDAFKDYQTRTGMTFNIEKGQVKYFKTLIEANLPHFVKEVNDLDLSAYDLIISDFEPVTAWAAKKQHKRVLGIGHQYAFRHKIPRQSFDPLAEQVLKYFAPADINIGLHWHHFGQPIFPPIIETIASPIPMLKDKIVVYLPFEDQQQVIDLLAPFTHFNFHIYSPEPIPSLFDHIIMHPLSREGFQQNLSDCAGIISNSGFELASECLQLGKKILAKPIHGQMEQLANAAALTQLGYGHVMNDLDANVIEHWLHNQHAIRIAYPNTAKLLVQWIQDGMPEMNKDFIADVWNKIDVQHVAN